MTKKIIKKPASKAAKKTTKKTVKKTTKKTTTRTITCHDGKTLAAVGMLIRVMFGDEEKVPVASIPAALDSSPAQVTELVARGLPVRWPETRIGDLADWLEARDPAFCASVRSA